jgi:hypothetical protein
MPPKTLIPQNIPSSPSAAHPLSLSQAQDNKKRLRIPLKSILQYPNPFVPFFLGPIVGILSPLPPPFPSLPSLFSAANKTNNELLLKPLPLLSLALLHPPKQSFLLLLLLLLFSLKTQSFPPLLFAN